MYELAPLPPGVRLLTDPEAERLQQKFPANLLPRSPEECVTCRHPSYPKPGKSTGSFRWWNEDRTEPVEWKCECVDQWILHRYLLNANVPLVYQRLFWADATHVDPDILAEVQRYLAKAESYVRVGVGLILHGLPGNGKTMLAALALKALLAQGYSGYFTTFSDLIALYTSTWHSDEERAWFDHHIRNVTFLVLDDPGKEYGGAVGSGLAGAAFDGVLRYRASSSLPTIVTTNLGPDAMPQRYGDGILGLLSERAVGIPFAAESFRRQHRDRTLEEVDLDLVRPIVAEVP